MSITAKEYRWAFIASLLIVLLSCLPLLVGYMSQTPEERFVGTMFDRQDYSVHLAMIHYGAEGGWDYQFRFTTETQTRAYVKIFYVIIGHLTGWTGLPADAIFQMARILFGLLACFSTYLLFTRVFATLPERWLAFALAMLGMGFGWFQTPLVLTPDPKVWPIDIWFPDPYMLFSVALFPHFSAAIAGMLIGLTAFLDHIELPRRRNIFIMSICAIFVQVISPIDFILVDAAMLGACLFVSWQKHKLNWASLRALALVSIVQIPLLVYSLVLLTRDPAWAVFNRQNVTLSPPPIYYLLGFGLFWPFALAGAIKALRKPAAGPGLALFWVVSAFVFAYMPLDIQRRFLIVVTIPLAILATPAILDFSGWLTRKLSLGRITAVLLISSSMAIGSVFLIAFYSFNLSRRPSNLFEPVGLFQAMDWLAQNGKPDDIVLASEPTAQLVAMRTPLRLYFGHEMETLYFDDKARQVQDYYRGTQPSSWLNGLPVTWVIYGPHESEWGRPPASPELQVAYDHNGVVIYRLNRPNPGR